MKQRRDVPKLSISVGSNAEVRRTVHFYGNQPRGVSRLSISVGSKVEELSISMESILEVCQDSPFVWVAMQRLKNCPFLWVATQRCAKTVHFCG